MRCLSNELTNSASIMIQHIQVLMSVICSQVFSSATWAIQELFWLKVDSAVAVKQKAWLLLFLLMLNFSY